MNFGQNPQCCDFGLLFPQVQSDRTQKLQKKTKKNPKKKKSKPKLEKQK